MSTRLGPLARRLSDADPEADEVWRAEGVDDRQHPVVPRPRTTPSDAHSAQMQVELVVDHTHLLRRDADVSHRLRHRLPGEVHVGLWHHKPHATRLRLTHQRIPSLALHLYSEALGELPDTGKTKVMARVGILRLRVAKADYQQLFSNQFLTHFKSQWTQIGPRRAPQTRFLPVRESEPRLRT